MKKRLFRRAVPGSAAAKTNRKNTGSGLYPFPACGMLDPEYRTGLTTLTGESAEKVNGLQPAGIWICAMKNRIQDVSLYKPFPEDLWFRQAMMADPETMSYNRDWGGTIPFPREEWEEWYEFWVKHPKKRFYRYITTGKSRVFVGETSYYYDSTRQIWLTGIVIREKSRRQGYGKAGLELLCAAARRAGIRELYDDIAADNPGIGLFLRCGFREESRSEGVIMLRKKLESTE